MRSTGRAFNEEGSRPIRTSLPPSFCFLTSLTASQSFASKPKFAVELFFAEERERGIGVGGSRVSECVREGKTASGTGHGFRLIVGASDV